MNNRPWYKDVRWLIGAIVVPVALTAIPIVIVYINPNFHMIVNPLTIEAEQGSTAEAIITVNSNRYKKEVGLITQERPSGVRVFYSPEIGIPPFTSNIIIKIDQQAPVGTHEITILGVGADGKERSCKYILDIYPIPLQYKIEITHPNDNASVEMREIVKGASQNITAELLIWIIVYPHEIDRFYPQDKPATIQAEGNWASSTLIGVEDDVGKKFDIITVLADESVNKEFEDYLTEAVKVGVWQGLKVLPQGAVIYDRITVTRK